MNNVYHLTAHALCRMEERQVNDEKVAQTLSHGQVFKTSKGLHRAKLREGSGKFIDEYIVVFSKQTSRIITVEHNLIRNKNFDGEFISKRQLSKIYKQRKRAINQAEYDTYCREECSNWNIRFSA